MDTEDDNIQIQMQLRWCVACTPRLLSGCKVPAMTLINVKFLLVCCCSTADSSSYTRVVTCRWQ